MAASASTGVLLLTPFEARAVVWGSQDDGTGSVAAGGVKARSWRTLARWRFDSGDTGAPGMAAIRIIC